MQKMPLKELLHELDEEMRRLGYTEGSMKFYRCLWQKLLQFAQERGVAFYSEQLGLDFAKERLNIFEHEDHHTLTRHEVQELRVIRIVGDYQLHRTILRRYYKHKQILTDPYFVDLSVKFREYCVDKKYSPVTVEHYVKQSARFMDYLVSQKIFHCEALTLDLIHHYIRTLAGYTYKTVEQCICAIRAFLRFLLGEKIIKEDFAAKTPMVQARKQTRIPSAWSKEELGQLINAIDRGSPKGKRDYAIILLACCLGMRSTDIKKLKMKDFHWEKKQIIFTQSKTKTSLSLPITPEVGWAVIDYLRYGRPKIESPYLFLKHMAPFEPFPESDHLYQLIQRYMQLAHLPVLKKHRGMHSLRHTMASMLLEKDTPLSTISDILGHCDTNSTAVYLKIDIKKLRECALDFGG